MKMRNKVRELREKKLMSKSELARKAGVSVVTIDRVEKGEACRLETMRKIILALGFTLEDRDMIFQEQG
ncbi:MAG: helix-turn-helix domain-containing protein [Trichlorobacter sp.]|jgi:DNA-binding XRE family transcriptional regulator